MSVPADSIVIALAVGVPPLEFEAVIVSPIANAPAPPKPPSVIMSMRLRLRPTLLLPREEDFLERIKPSFSCVYLHEFVLVIMVVRWLHLCNRRMAR